MRIEAWKCEADGTVFEFEKDYKTHMARLAKARRDKRAIELRKESEAKWWNDNFYNNVRSLAQLQDAILYHAEEIGKRAMDRYWLADKCRGYPVIVDFVKFDVQYNESVSNSHSNPINGVRNWGGKVRLPDGTPAPTGYPGLRGRLEYHTVNPRDCHLSSGDLWDGTRLHSGTGSGGHCQPSDKYPGKLVSWHGYQFELFLSDWPALEQEYNLLLDEEKERLTMHVLKHGHRYGFTALNPNYLNETINDKYPAGSYQPATI